MKHDNSYSYKPQYDPFENVMTRNGLHADEVISALYFLQFSVIS